MSRNIFNSLVLFILVLSIASPVNASPAIADPAYVPPIAAVMNAPAQAHNGQIIQYKIVLDGNGGELREPSIITDTLPAGVSFTGNLTSTYGTAQYNSSTNTVTWTNSPSVLGTGSVGKAVLLGDNSTPLSGVNSVPPPYTGGPVSLAIDDGTAEGATGANADMFKGFLWLNRFTPSPAEFPFKLKEVQVYFMNNGYVSVGDPLEIVIYENKSGNENLSTGSNLLTTVPVTVQALAAWNTFTLPTPVAFTGPGDVLIGVFMNLDPNNQKIPAAKDETTSLHRSWIGFWTTQPSTPTLPPNGGLFTLESINQNGNFMVRGSGETIPVPSTITVTFDTTVTIDAGDITNHADVLYAGALIPIQATTSVINTRTIYLPVITR